MGNFEGKVKKNMSYSSTKKLGFLICFDNAEELIEHCEYDFQLLLKELTDSCPLLKIVITSNKPLDQEFNLVQPMSRYFSSLKPMQATELFIEILRKNKKIVKGRDVFDLILAEKNYPIRKLRSDHTTSRIFKSDITPEFTE